MGDSQQITELEHAAARRPARGMCSRRDQITLTVLCAPRLREKQTEGFLPSRALKPRLAVLRHVLQDNYCSPLPVFSSALRTINVQTVDTTPHMPNAPPQIARLRHRGECATDQQVRRWQRGATLAPHTAEAILTPGAQESDPCTAR